MSQKEIQRKSLDKNETLHTGKNSAKSKCNCTGYKI